MRVLIIGGTKFIGPSVVSLLCDWGHEVMISIVVSTLINERSAQKSSMEIEVIS